MTCRIVVIVATVSVAFLIAEARMAPLSAQTGDDAAGGAQDSAGGATDGATDQQQLPDVDVVQPEQQQQQQAQPPQQQSQPQQQAQPAVDQQPSFDPEPTGFAEDNFADAPVAEPAGAAPSGRSPDNGRLNTRAKDTTSPVDASSILPRNLQNYPGAGNRVGGEQLNEQSPLTNHDALARVPGVVTVQDDGLARHGGVSIRGSNFRRSRKILTLEDGHPINYSSYIDPSTHYTPPLDRVESIEILRGAPIQFSPLTNHGVINFQNLNPFGKSETVIKSALIYTDDALQEFGNSRHVHTRQNFGNVGVVASYSGADASGAWDNERLRYNDFFGSLGFRGTLQDLIISGGYFRQRDDYDEDNFSGPLSAFFANGHDKTGAKPDAETRFNTFNGDFWHLQLAHNLYIDPNTTLSTRAYIADHRRYRFSHRDGGLFEDGAHMRGRNRDYSTHGVDSRIEFANLPLFNGVRHDLQVGVKYERQRFRNCTAFGRFNQKLDNNTTGNCLALGPDDGGPDPDTAELNKFDAYAFSAWVQTAIHLTDNLTVTPGVRFEDYEIDALAIHPEPAVGETDHDHVLPSVAVSWEFMPRWTFYGGYHRGFAPHIIRETDPAALPLDEEVGDNFQVGLRSSAIQGLTFDVAYFHSLIENYQIKEPFTTEGTGANIFGNLEEVEFNGIELGLRAESRPMTGGPWNFFGEAVYTWTNSEINKGQDALFEDGDLQDASGNRVPFSVEHYAALTLGVAYKNIWDISATATYRGDFFSDALNNDDVFCEAEDGGGDEVIDFGCDGVENGMAVDVDEALGGKVDDVWLLSARANFNVSDQLSLFVAGHNLTDELYVSDVADGLKPGQGRTIRGGFTWKFDN